MLRAWEGKSCLEEHAAVIVPEEMFGHGRVGAEGGGDKLAPMPGMDVQGERTAVGREYATCSTATGSTRQRAYI